MTTRTKDAAVSEHIRLRISSPNRESLIQLSQAQKLPKRHPETPRPQARIKPEQNSDKKEAEEAPNLLSAHHQKRH